MDAGAPEPCVERDGDRAWVAYLAHDPEFPSWDAPDVAEYVGGHPGELFGVLRFDGVTRCFLGSPNDERLHEHPLYARGLKFYEFHRVLTRTDPGWWIVTFHDETLEVHARSAQALPARFAASPAEAISRARAET